MRSTELARRLDCSDTAVRNWSRRFARFLSPEAAGGDGSTREYSPADALVIATVQRLSMMGHRMLDIEAQLETGWRIEALPEAPSPEREAALQAVQLVPVERLAVVMQEVERMRSEVARLEVERDKAADRERQARERVAELQRELGQVEGLSKGQVEIIRRLEADIERLRGELEAARNRRRGLFG